MSDWPHPPYSIRTERLHLRCFHPADAPAFKALIDRNLDHLGAWLAWARRDRRNLAETRELLRRFRGNFDLGVEFTYGIFTPEEGGVLGTIGLHPRCGPGGLEMGYWVGREHGGRGYAREAAASLTQVAVTVLGADRVEIRVQPDNEPSLAIPRALGFRLEAELARRLPWPDEAPRDLLLWTLFASEYASSPAAGQRLELRDATDALMVPAPSEEGVA